MIQTYPDTEIYVYCPAGVVTGGAELLHQLVSVLNDNGKNAYIVYFGEAEHKIPNDYLCYNLKLKSYDKIEDNPQNVEVIYEGRFDLAFRHKNMQKVLWWLSVDNFFKCSVPYINLSDIIKYYPSLIFKWLRNRLGKVIRHRNPFTSVITIKKLRKLNALNAYQSEYAHNFLQNNGFAEMLPLKDYINDEHQYDENLKKEDIILYNPKKGTAFTKKIIKSAPHLHWVPLQGMTRKELINTIRKAKLYIDFGEHPGKDRLPRECAMNGCCIITGKRGSANFFEDVRVYNNYKFDDKTSLIPQISNRITEVLCGYDSCIDDFKFYREEITREKQEFISDILRIFR